MFLNYLSYRAWLFAITISVELKTHCYVSATSEFANNLAFPIHQIRLMAVAVIRPS